MGLFGRRYLEPPPLTGDMLDEDRFWSIVNSSLRETNSQDAQEAWLIRRLEKLTPAEMVGFRLRTDKLLYDTYTSEMWCAAYIMNGGCSDDGFEYFRCWLIARGSDVYAAAKNNPDTLAGQPASDDDYYEFESFWYVALQAFENKTGKALYDYIDPEFEWREAKYPAISLNWEEEDPESMRRICPRLFEKFAHNFNWSGEE